MMHISNILCVDDEPDIRTVLGLCLRQTLDVNVVTLATANAVFEHLATNPLPDLIVLDRNLDGADGVVVCRQLRANPRFQHIPVVFLSARTRQCDIEEALAAGAVAFLAKPFDPAAVGRQLLAAVERAQVR